MTTDAERECYYRLTKDAAGKGEIVELGAWLGASTAYIAAGVRDSGVQTKAHVYDKFESKIGHIDKVKAFYEKHGLDKAPTGPCLQSFTDNLGPLIDYVEPHAGQIENMQWDDKPIALLVTDAPKRVPAISSVLTKLRHALQPGSIMAWQDFCHFPSYEIPACLYRLREHLEFVEAVVPGTTLVFRVKSSWRAEEVSPEVLALSRWTHEEIDEAWVYWSEFVPEEKALLFDCGAAMFLSDIGEQEKASYLLQAIDWKAMRHNRPEVRKKWRYLKSKRPDFVVRYHPLFAYLESQGAI
jgi:hypothetical protein